MAKRRGVRAYGRLVRGRRRRAGRARTAKRWSRRRLIVRALAGALVVLVVVPVVLVLPWRWVAPPTSAFMVRARVRGEGPVYYHWVDWDAISPELAIAAVAAEDQKFPTHAGFDWDAIDAALARNRRGGARFGASTISQQLAKNLFLWPRQSWVRKGLEAYLTVWMELLWPKRRILEVYLNVAEFGPGVFGVGAASERLMAKAPAELTGRDAALLVAVLPSPKRMSAAAPSNYVRRRAGQIQGAVRQLGGPRYLAGL